MAKRGPKGAAYSDALSRRICDMVAEGASLGTIAEMPGMPARRSVRDWLEQHPDFERRYEIARRERTDNLVDEAITIADSVAGAKNNAAVQAAKLRVDTRRWLASKLLPERFGDRAAVELTGKGGGDLIPADPDRDKVLLALLAVLRPGDVSPPTIDATPEQQMGQVARPEPRPADVFLQPLPDYTLGTARERMRLRLLQFPSGTNR